MKRTSLIAVLAGFAIVAILSQDALARNRMYNPAVGRFMQRDPAGTELAGPAMARSLSGPQYTRRDPSGQYRDGMNLYQYCRSRPPVLTDPTGLITPEEIAKLLEELRHIDEMLEEATSSGAGARVEELMVDKLSRLKALGFAFVAAAVILYTPETANASSEIDWRAIKAREEAEKVCEVCVCVKVRNLYMSEARQTNMGFTRSLARNRDTILEGKVLDDGEKMMRKDCTAKCKAVAEPTRSSWQTPKRKIDPGGEIGDITGLWWLDVTQTEYWTSAWDEARLQRYQR